MNSADNPASPARLAPLHQDACLKNTISIAFVHEALQGLRRLGGEVDEVLVQAGISPKLLQVPQARVSPGQYSALWRALTMALDDEFLGFSSRRMKQGAFSMLCHSVIHGETLEAGLQRALRFYSLIFDDIGAVLCHDNHLVQLRLTQQERPLELFAQASFMHILHSLASWLIGRRIPIVKSDFAAPAPSYAEEYAAIFSTVMHFEAPYTAITFHERHLGAKIIQTKETLWNFLSYAPASFLMSFREGSTFSERIRVHLEHTYVSQWPDFDAMARQLNMTPSTLRRRLEEQGQPYQLIKDDLRCDLAVVLLGSPDKSVADIAAELGFSETSAFYRAFKKWTGLSLSDYRNQQNPS